MPAGQVRGDVVLFFEIFYNINMGAFYFIFCAVSFLMQLAVAAWLGRCFPALGIRGPLLFGAVCTAVMFAGLVGTRTYQSGVWASCLYYFAYTYFGLMFLAFCTCTILAWFDFLLKSFHVKTFWMGYVTLLTLLVVFGLSFWGGFRTPALKRIAVQIPGAPKMKLALLSDTHLGMGVSVARFEKVLQKIEAQKPDALLVLGDIFEYGPHREKYAALLRQVRTPLGSVGVLGNHEYYVGYEGSKNFYKDCGVTLLENTAVTLPNGVQVAGLKDIRTAGVTPRQVEELLGSLDPQKPILLLSHTPLLAEQAARHGADLMLSGHTHNGQLWPFHYLVKMQFPRIYGLHDVNGMKFYITSGIFYWGIPLRFLSPAEIVLVEVNP